MKKLLIMSMILLTATVSTFSQIKPKSSNSYTLTVNSNANPYTLIIDGTLIKGNSAKLKAGNHSILVKSNGFNDYRTNLTLTKNMVINATLQPISRKYTLTVNSNVKPYTLSIDGKLVKGNRAVLNSGQHTILVQSNGYTPYKTTLSLGKNMVINATLKPMIKNYTLTVNSNIKPYTVFIDGALIKGNRSVLPEGTHNVKVQSNGFNDYETNMNLNKNMVINATLKPIIRNFTLTVNSNIKPYTVFIDGALVNGNRAVLTEGTHNVKVQSNGFNDYETNMNLNKNMVINATLIPLSAFVSVYIPENIINKSVNGALNQLRIFDNNILVNGFNFEVTPGTHTIRIESGAFSLESSHTFEPGMNYNISPVMYLNVE